MDGIQELIRLVNVVTHRKEDAKLNKNLLRVIKLYFEAANFGL